MIKTTDLSYPEAADCTVLGPGAAAPTATVMGCGMAAEDALSESLAGLSSLLIGSGNLEETLVRVAELAVLAIPRAEGSGLTLIEADRPQTVVATADFVRVVDDIQYRLNEGPCVSAVAERRTFTSGNLGGEPQWPRFGPRVGRLGVHSALSLPLLITDRVVGALNVYATPRNAFGEHALALGEAFAGPAAVSVANAQLLAQAERLTTQLQVALTSRAMIDQALGVIMSQSGVTSEQAFERLRHQSQTRSVKLADVAGELLAAATRRARARHAEEVGGAGQA